MGEVDYALAEIFEMDRPRGAFVDAVQPGSPAQAAGILDEDIILEFNGHQIDYYTDLPFYVGQYRPGTQASVLIFRNGELDTLTVELGSSPTNTVAQVEPQVTRQRRNRLGFRVMELSREQQVAGIRGVRIVELNDGPGREAGLLLSDVIIALDRKEITSPEDFAAVAGRLPESGFVSVRIVREGQGTTRALELSR